MVTFDQLCNYEVNVEIELKARLTLFGISFLSLCNIFRYILISAYMYRLFIRIITVFQLLQYLQIRVNSLNAFLFCSILICMFI